VHRLDAIARALSRLGKEEGPELDAGAPRAAVAAILRESPAADGAELFFIQRAEHPSDPWSGHIAFPGGRRDPGDVSLLATAIRETREEAGLDLERAELIARLPDVPAFSRSKRGRLVVTPWVFALREPAEIVPNREVASTLWVPMASLARGEGKGTYAFTYDEKDYELPCIRLEPGQKVLWGMTYRMLETMLEGLQGG
jgi:8-oxo-dGTP pyrophosphatase MutT (NUDIX family)